MFQSIELKNAYPNGLPSSKLYGPSSVRSLSPVRSSSPDRGLPKSTTIDDENEGFEGSETMETMSFLSMEGHGPGGSTIAGSTLDEDGLVSNVGDE